MHDKRVLLLPIILFTLLLTLSSFCPPQSRGHDTAEEELDSWHAPSWAIHRPNPVHADENSIERGQHTFRQYCVTCHGRSGRGDGSFAERLITEPPDLTTVSQHHSDGELAWKIATGNNPMPRWENILDEEQIWDIVNYIRSIGKDNIQAQGKKHNEP